jgi:hypothetical protein
MVSPARPSAPATQGGCAAKTDFETRGVIHWSGITYVGLGQSSLKDADRGLLQFRIGCTSVAAYAVKGVSARCEVMIFKTDAYDLYAPQPAPQDCPPIKALATSTPAPTTAPDLSDCPSLHRQQPGHAVSEDFGDVVVADGTDFVAESPPRTTITTAHLGPAQFTVRCSYSALNTATRQQTPELRDHDSAFIPAGQPVYALKGWPPSCRLVAQHDDEWHVYLALDPVAAPGTPKPCATSTDGSGSGVP